MPITTQGDLDRIFNGALNVENLTLDGFSIGATTPGPGVFTTLTSTVSVPRAPVAVGASTVLTSSSAGKTILLDTAAGSTVTLPAATGSGSVYRFVVRTTTTSGAHKILAASSSDFITGIATGMTNSTGALKGFQSAAATNHSIQMPFTGSQPSGGFIGDWFEFADIAANLWEAYGMYGAGTTATTCFSSATT